MGKPKIPKRKYTRKAKPTTPAIIEIADVTPINQLTQFLEAWKAQDWTVMSDCCQLSWFETVYSAYTREGWLEMTFGHMKLKAYKIMPNHEKTKYMLTFDVKTEIINHEDLQSSIKINVVYEADIWGVNPISAMQIQWSAKCTRCK